MATKEQVFKASILINSEQAINNIAKLKQQIADVRERGAKAFAEGRLDVWKAANKEAEALTRKLDKQQKLAHGFSETIKNLSTAKSKELQELIKQINKELDSPLIKKGSEEWKAYVAVLKEAKTELAKMKDATQENRSAWSKFFKFLNESWGGLAILFQSITGISQTIRKSVQEYADMEEEMANTRKYTGMTEEQVRDLNEAFKEMDTRTSREQLNQLAGAAGRLGLQSKEDIMDFVQAADMIGVALGDDLGDGAVDKIGKLAMAFGEDDKMGLKGAMLATGSALNELAQNSSAQAGYLVEFTARVAGFGKQLGLTQAQIMGFGTVMDENLLKDEMAATAFGNMLTKMQTNTQVFAQIAGKSIEDFTKLLREDANGAILAVADSLKRQDPTTMMKMLDSMGLDGSRAVGVLSTLADKIDDVRKHQQRATEAYAEGTSVINEYGTMNNTVQARIDKCKKAFQEMTIELGERLLPVVKYTISSGSLLVKGLSVLMKFIYDFKTAIITLTASIVLWNIQTIASVTWHKALKPAIDAVTSSVKQFYKVLATNPYAAAAAAAAVLVAIIYDLAKASNEASKAQNVLNDIENESKKNAVDETAEMEQLIRQLDLSNISTDKRRELLEEINGRLMKEHLGNLTEEDIKTGKAKDTLELYNKALQNRIKNELKMERLKEAMKKKEDAENGEVEWTWMDTFNYIMFGSQEQHEYIRNDEGGFDVKISNRQTRIQERVIKEQQEIIDAIQAELDDDYVKDYIHERLAEQGKALREIEGNIESGSNKNQYDTKGYWEEEIKERKRKLKELREDANSTASAIEDAEKAVKEAQGKLDSLNGTSGSRKEEKEADKREKERQRKLKERADEAKATYQEELACEMLSYRQGLTSYTDYMEKRHSLTQDYYDKLKSIYGENSKEYKKALLQQERDEQEYNQWQNKQKDNKLLQEKYVREHNIRMEYARKGIKDEDSLNESLFESDIAYLKQKQNLYQKGSKEWIEIEQQIQQKERQHQFELEQSWMQRLSKYREEAGMMDYKRMMEVEMKGVESFYGALLTTGQMTKEEYDAIIEHIKMKYEELAASQNEDNSIKKKAGKALDTAKKKAGAESVSAGNDAASGIFSVSQAVSQQKMINEQLKALYGEDYENNREYQEAKRQLDAETMQTIVAGAQAAYSTINSLMSAASNYAQACSDLEVAKITANYDKQIEAAGNNSKKKERLEKERDKKIAQAKTQANQKAMAMEMAQAIAQTALGAISAYSSTMAGAPYPANLVLAPISAGIALAAGALQIATIKKQHEAEAVGYYEGGFTGGRRYRKEAGVVHEGEFVANHQAVNNPDLMPVLCLIDQAQRNNRVGSLRAEDVTNVMGGPAAAAVVAPVVNINNDNEELREVLEASGTATYLLLDRLKDPIEANVVLTGSNGLNAQQKRLNNMLKNK